MFYRLHYILACCTRINVSLSGDANKYKGSMAGIYYMQSGFSNGQRYWMSPEGNAIWNVNDETDAGLVWAIAPSKDLGSIYFSLYLPIKDPSRECPSDDLLPKWQYYTENGAVEEVNNNVLVECLP